MWDAATQDRRRNERIKLWIFREIAKWRRWRHAQRLTATAVITDSGHRFSKRWHVTDINIAGDDQTTLMVHRNFADLECTFRFYVCLRLCDCNCCSAADGSGSCHAPAPSYFEEMTRCRHQNLHWRWPGNPNSRLKFCKFRFVYVYTICNWYSSGSFMANGGFQRSLKWHVTDVKNIAGMTRIDRNSANTKIYAYKI